MPTTISLERASAWNRHRLGLIRPFADAGAAVKGVLVQAQHYPTYFKPWYSDPSGLTTRDAQLQLIRRFIGRYGPVTTRDVAYWPGFTLRATGRIMQALKPELEAVTLQGSPREAYVVASDLGPLCDLSLDDDSRELYLPPYDLLLLAYADKRRFTDEDERKRVFLSAARVLPSGKANPRRHNHEDFR